MKLIAASILLACVCIGSVSMFAGTVAWSDEPQWLSWSELPPVPDELGYAGPFAGVHNDTLIMARGANFAKPVWESEKQWHDNGNQRVSGTLELDQRGADNSCNFVILWDRNDHDRCVALEHVHRFVVDRAPMPQQKFVEQSFDVFQSTSFHLLKFALGHSSVEQLFAVDCPSVGDRSSCTVPLADCVGQFKNRLVQLRVDSVARRSVDTRQNVSEHRG